MKKTIKERTEELTKREEKLKIELENNERRFMSKARRLGKIALVTGLITLVGYWIYRSFFQKEPKTEEKAEKVSMSAEKNIASKIGTLLIPIMVALLKELIQSKVLKRDDRTKG